MGETILLHAVACNCGVCGGKSGWNSEDDTQTFLGDATIGAPSGTATKEVFGAYLTDGYWQDVYSQYGAPYSTADFRGWTDTSLTFSIANGYSASEKAGIRDAFAQWSDVTNLTFTEVSSGGQIYLELPGSQSETGRAFAQVGWSFSGGNATIVNPVRIVIDYDSGGFGSDPSDLGNYALMTAIHEIGHAIGLGHSGYYNAGQGNPSYNNDGQWVNDTRQFSLMSYWSASYSGASHLGEYASTPMLMDIYAVQTLYGANYTTRSGNTIYGFNSNAGSDQYDFSVNVRPVVAIWDGGGTDTLDASGYSNNQKISLIEGDFSNIGSQTGNVVIAYGAVIENATGGSGNDSIYGNAANNILKGGLGDDTLYGSTGNDVLDGEGGTDIVTYSYDISSFLVYLVDSVTLTLHHIVGNWDDTIRNIESFIFNNTTLTFDEVAARDVSDLADIALRFDWTGGLYRYVSGEVETHVMTAAMMGYNGASGNMARIDRDGSEFLVTLLSTSSPATMSIGASAENDVIRVTGSNTNLNLKIYGNEGDDTITVGGISGNIILYGMDGNDTINGGLGHDTIYGDKIKSSDIWTGNDIIHGYGGNDTIYGNGGDDTLYGDDGDDDLWGQEGNDTIYGGNNNDRVWGGEGDDTMYGGLGHDVLRGEEGDDEIYGNDGDDWIDGGADNDTLYGDNGNDTIYGGAGVDTLHGGEGVDMLYGEAGNDTLNGNNGADRLYGGAGDDIVYGGAGDDAIYGDKVKSSDIATGNDTLYGEDGDDVILGHGGNDTLYGGTGADKLYGGEGNDRLEGGAGGDVLYGDDGNDLLIGGSEKDYMIGGAGNDVFAFATMDGSIDVIQDFTLTGAERDSINITDLLSGYNHGVSDINDFVYLAYRNADRTDLRINADGQGNDWTYVSIIQGSNFTGTTVDDLLASGQLIINQSL